MKRIALLFSVIIVSQLDVNAQVLYPGTYLTDYYKILELKNPKFGKRIMVRPSNLSYFQFGSEQPWNPWGDYFKMDSASKNINVLPLISSMTVNPKYPRGYNDGPVWKGKGFNADINFGVKGNLGILHYTFAPVIYFAQNLDFEKVDRGIYDPRYAYQFERNVDWVQRYGEDSFTTFSWGQSDLRLIYKKLTLGVSTQNVTWGPAQVNPILMSNNSAMFPHIDLGTDTPFETLIGDLEFRLYWGLMTQSDYFSDELSAGDRYFQGLSAHFRPSFMKGFSLGINRVHYRDTDIQEFELGELFLFLADFSSNQDSLNGGVVNDVYDGLVSVNIDWKFEEVGFEAYMEIARNDFSNFTSLSREPEHTRAYTLGFIKLFDVKENHTIKTSYEHTVIGNPRLEVIRGAPTYYEHYLAKAGYTQNGQILGAGIGPGGNGDIGDIAYYYPKGFFSVGFQRIRFNDDFAFDTFTRNNRPFDVEYTYSLKALRFFENGLTAGLDIYYSDRLNWHYIEGNMVDNVQVKLTLGYHPFLN